MQIYAMVSKIQQAKYVGVIINFFILCVRLAFFKFSIFLRHLLKKQLGQEFFRKNASYFSDFIFKQFIIRANNFSTFR